MLQYCSGEYKPKAPCKRKHITPFDRKQFTLLNYKHMMLLSDNYL
jgi:hypothetical protein